MGTESHPARPTTGVGVPGAEPTKRSDQLASAQEATVSRYLVWVCCGCPLCEPFTDEQRSDYPCTHDSPSCDGAWVVKADDFEAVEADRDRLAAALREAQRAIVDLMGAGFDSERRHIGTAAYDAINETFDGVLPCI